MALRLSLTDGTGVQGLQAVFGAFIDTSVAATAADAAAAAASALQASTSATAAAASATDADSSAAAAATSAAAALASQASAASSASAAAGSATTASTAATAAANSATAASGSATAAAGSATSAGTSASAAATSASNAAATLANALTKANNLSDVASSATAAANLGLGTSSTVTFANVRLGLSTAHGVLIGQAASALTFVGPSATTGLPLVNNAAADPGYAMLTVVGGGTGLNTLATGSVPVGNGVGPLTAVAPSTAGQALISKGASIAPAFGFPSGTLLNVQVLTSSGTYNPIDATNTKSIIFDMQAGGAGSAGLPTNGASLASVSGAGSTGGYMRHRMTSGFTGVSYTIAAGGAAGTSGGGTGGTGGNSTFGSLTATGATGQVPATGLTNGAAGSGAVGDATGGNIINVRGTQASSSWVISSAGLIVISPVNPSAFGGGRYGYGGNGVGNGGGGAAVAGVSGGGGIIIVYEFA